MSPMPRTPRRRTHSLIATTVLTLTALACAPDSETSEPEKPAQAPATPLPAETPVGANPNNRKLSGPHISLFMSRPDSSQWTRSDFTVFGGAFINSWDADNVSVMKGGGLNFRLEPNIKGAAMPYVGAELQRVTWAQYGRLEGIIKAAPKSGAVGGLFTHTNEYFKDTHEEIDLEWLGVRPRMVSLNIWHKGKQDGPWEMQTPFDVTAEHHLYAFEWTPTEIVWYLDGHEILRKTDKDVVIPQVPQRLIAHLWTGKMTDWHGDQKLGDGTDMHLMCWSYTPMGDTTSPTCGDHMDLVDNPLTAEQAAAIRLRK